MVATVTIRTFGLVTTIKTNHTTLGKLKAPNGPNIKKIDICNIVIFVIFDLYKTSGFDNN